VREWSGEEARGMSGEGLGGVRDEEEGGWSGGRGRMGERERKA
jgi:hypothetical protein